MHWVRLGLCLTGFYGKSEYITVLCPVIDGAANNQ